MIASINVDGQMNEWINEVNKNEVNPWLHAKIMWHEWYYPILWPITCMA